MNERSDDLRRQSRDRLRSGFLGQSVRQLREMVAMLGRPDLDAPMRDTIAHELERIVQTAQSFALDELSDAARTAQVAVLSGGEMDALGPIARALRSAGGQSRFPPIQIVAVEPLAGRLQVEAGRCCETVEIFASIRQMQTGVRWEDPQALVVPFEALAQLSEEDRRLPLVVYGPADDLAARRAAARAGAIAFLPERVEFRVMLDRIRTHAYRARGGAPRALIVHPDEARRNAIVARLVASGVTAQAVAVDAMLTGLDEASPELIVVDGSAGAELAPVVRGHARFYDAMLVALASDDVARLLDLGVDAVLDPGVDDGELASRIGSLVRTARNRSAARDPATGLRDRTGMLRAVDRATAEARRGARTIAVGVVELDGLGDVHRKHGRAPADQALRVLARCIESTVRANDVVGRLGGDAILVLLPGCNAEQARRRLTEIRTLYSALCTRDERVASVNFSAGVADTDDGVDGLLLRAEEALERARARDARGAIG